MKANAPEKIYIQSFNNSEENTFYFDAIWTEKPESGQENIEYTRTDAFIEKAKKWFEIQNEGVDSDGNYKCDMTDFEDFRNYIKGE